jgi:hypothetical protein
VFGDQTKMRKARQMDEGSQNSLSSQQAHSVMPPGFPTIFVMDTKFSLSNVALLNCRLVECGGKTALDHHESS